MTGGTRLDRARRSVRTRLGRRFGSEVKAEAGGSKGAEQSRVEQSKGGQDRTEHNRTEQSRGPVLSSATTG